MLYIERYCSNKQLFGHIRAAGTHYSDAFKGKLFYNYLSLFEQFKGLRFKGMLLPV